MPQPKRIILIRHGESAKNADGKAYAKVPTYAYGLTDKGKHQAKQAGKKLKETIGDESTIFYVSDYWRTRETFAGIAESFPEGIRANVRFEPLLREITLQGRNMPSEEPGAPMSHFYDQSRGGRDGEAPVQVYDRICSFLNEVKFDWIIGTRKEQNAVVVAHNYTMRCILTKMSGRGMEAFDKMREPKNCEIITLTLQENGLYLPSTDLCETKDQIAAPPLRTHIPEGHAAAPIEERSLKPSAQEP